MMKTILLTGPIGSGKSEVSRYLLSKNIPVYDCDRGVKDLYKTEEGLISRIENELSLSFERLNEVFASEEKLQKLEAIVYPVLIEDILLWKKEHSAEKVVFIESAIALMKREFDFLYDEVLMIDAPYSLRVKRNSKAEQRDGLQTFDLQRVNTIIVNDSTINELYQKINYYYDNRFI